VGLEPAGWAVTGEEQALIHSRIGGRRRLCDHGGISGALEVEVCEWGLGGEAQDLQDKFGGKIGRIGRKWSKWLGRAILCSLLVFWSGISELKASLENADICYYSRGFSNLLCYQHHPYTQSETKLDGVQGIMRFGKLPTFVIHI
jgi:hypothetical protein